ncbi:MAG: exonuclease SbcCD subunit D [Lachnospira sp.]
MKIIHCADVHLDSNMTSNMDADKAKERKNEILITFRKMCRYAADNQVGAVIIAGDLFDKKAISKTAVNAVKSAILDNPLIDFYYLKGNHDAEGFLNALESIPDNLKLFGSEWTSYVVNPKTHGNITISGVELSSDNSGAIADSLMLKADNFNIVTLHGQESEYSKKDKVETINIRMFKNKCVDYLALGHIHSYREQQLDARGIYCYSGCLEGRGFDESGEHGFVLLDIDEEKLTCTREFINIAARQIYTEDVDVTGCMETSDIAKRIEENIKTGCYREGSLMKFTLVGELDALAEKNTDYLVKLFNRNFYYLKINDETTTYVDYNKYLPDISLKGEFVRNVMNDSALDEKDKADMVRMGLKLLSGEEI